MVERVKTGIGGLDELIGGGFPKGRTILVTGSCGTGKSIFGMQFLYKGAAEFDEPGLLVAFDEMPDKIRNDMLNFGWDIAALEKKNKLAIIDVTSAKAGVPSEEEHAILPGQMDIDKILIDIISVARNIGAKRLVIDSVPSMAFRLDSEHEVRKSILKLSYVTARAGMTTVLITEAKESETGVPSKFSKYGVEEYISDGVIVLSLIGGASQTGFRTLYIRKMRGTKHEMALHPMDLGDKGMLIKKTGGM